MGDRDNRGLGRYIVPGRQDVGHFLGPADVVSSRSQDAKQQKKLGTASARLRRKPRHMERRPRHNGRACSVVDPELWYMWVGHVQL